MLFQTLVNMIRALVKRLDKGPALGLDCHHINEMIQTGLHCPGFNPPMKWRVAEAGRDVATLQRMSREYLAYFPFETLTWLRPFDVTALTVRSLSFNLPGYFCRSFLTIDLVLRVTDCTGYCLVE